MRLYELADAWRRLGDAIEDALGEVTPEIDAALLRTEAAMGERVDACLVLAREAEAEVEALRAEISRLTDRRRAAERRAESLRGYVLRCLTEAGLTRLRGERFTVTVSPGRPRVVVDDLEALPPEAVRVKREPDKTVLGAMLEAGAVPGAHVEIGPPSLRVR